MDGYQLAPGDLAIVHEIDRRSTTPRQTNLCPMFGNRQRITGQKQYREINKARVLGHSEILDTTVFQSADNVSHQRTGSPSYISTRS
jgi:hypothetical protein